MKSPSLLAVSTVESRQLLFKILDQLPFFLLSNECALVCSIAIVHFVPYLSYNIIIFYLLCFFRFRSGNFAVHKLRRFINRHLDNRHDGSVNFSLSFEKYRVLSDNILRNSF